MDLQIRYPGRTRCTFSFDPELAPRHTVEGRHDLDVLATTLIQAIGLDHAMDLSIAILARLDSIRVRELAAELPPQSALAVFYTPKGVPIGFREVNIEQIDVESDDGDLIGDIPYDLNGEEDPDSDEPA